MIPQNAVATVIYTRAMRSQLAVAMAALFNFFGVLLGGLSVAYAIVHMLPTDLLLNMGSAHGLAMVFSMLLAAIIWNLGTWYFGLPASSSHTLNRRYHRYWFNQCADDRHVRGRCVEYPESHRYFWLTYHLTDCRSSGCWRPDFHFASLLERYQKTCPYSPDACRT